MQAHLNFDPILKGIKNGNWKQIKRELQKTWKEFSEKDLEPIKERFSTLTAIATETTRKLAEVVEHKLADQQQQGKKQKTGVSMNNTQNNQGGFSEKSSEKQTAKNQPNNQPNNQQSSKQKSDADSYSSNNNISENTDKNKSQAVSGVDREGMGINENTSDNDADLNLNQGGKNPSSSKNVNLNSNNQPRH